ncbi:beta-galactoside alpha-2,6-sialyltransferase 2 [Macrosteles quadrilineatus]|uniref:beta-galactoside alpha-2,6-sialyltransferase 2 n=1 Tax=Macrosteles quadrilineatus TaxID=74068 RepID=UPI0023E0FCC8|nr:beta-galactoside alpha-2,6-sialyltransferase 2 [Macrosteles quadrilineatus]
MKAIAVSVWIFINLVFFGMCGYIYLLWSQYWHYISRHQRTETYVKKVDNRPIVDYFQDTIPLDERIEHLPQELDWVHQKTTPLIVRKKSKPRFTKVHFTDPPSVALPCGPECNSGNKLTAFKNQLVVRLRRVLHEESNVFKSRADNPYNVNYNVQRGPSSGVSPQKLICDLYRTLPEIHTVRGKGKPFEGTDLGRAIPSTPLFGENERYNNCAIVTNAASFLGSNLGPLIDSHDFVLRFNHAPTEGYEADVGSKTSLRMLNSQVVSKPHFNFLKSKMYQGVRLLAWDPSNYTSTLQQWRRKPDFDVFTPYLHHRHLYPDTPLYLVDPRDLWHLWDFLQARTPARIRRNPPSSGFLGLALLLPHCAYVNLFEYVPSMRLTKRCHYFDDDEDASCTFGVWHPLAAEKLLALNFNTAADKTVFKTGYITVPGYQTLGC